MTETWGFYRSRERFGILNYNFSFVTQQKNDKNIWNSTGTSIIQSLIVATWKNSIVILIATSEKMAKTSQVPSIDWLVWSTTVAPTTKHRNTPVCIPTRTAAILSLLKEFASLKRYSILSNQFVTWFLYDQIPLSRSDWIRRLFCSLFLICYDAMKQTY